MNLTPDLTERVVIVTGASSGIGAELATGLASAGATVVLVGRDTKRLEAVRDTLPGKATVVRADLAVDGEAQRIVDETVSAHGAIDGIVHSAGLFEVGPVEDGLAQLDRQWQVNVRAPYALTAAALPALRKGASLLFVTSLAAHVGIAESTAYSATKGAVERLVKTLAVEVAPRGVRVNAIAPGHIRTPMNEGILADPDYEAEMVARTPLGRIGLTRDLVPLAVLLASDLTSFITGESVLVDGGWAAV
jgi:NAD(P)-dependent dehydrogenase (short-subunit alcohol dehydrogenase family)